MSPLQAIICIILFSIQHITYGSPNTFNVSTIFSILSFNPTTFKGDKVQNFNCSRKKVLLCSTLELNNLSI